MNHGYACVYTATGMERRYGCKRAVNRASEEAFSKLVLAVIEPGSRLAAVTKLPDQH